MVHTIFFPLNLASSLLFFKDFTITEFDTSIPKVLFTSSGSRTSSLDFSTGVEFPDPVTLIEYNSNPAICKVFAITASTPSAAILSVAVTSTSKLLVFVFISVSFAFAIGGSDIVCPAESIMIGTLA